MGCGAWNIEFDVPWGIRYGLWASRMYGVSCIECWAWGYRVAARGYERSLRGYGGTTHLTMHAETGACTECAYVPGHAEKIRGRWCSQVHALSGVGGPYVGRVRGHRGSQVLECAGRHGGLCIWPCTEDVRACWCSVVGWDRSLSGGSGY